LACKGILTRSRPWLKRLLPWAGVLALAAALPFLVSVVDARALARTARAAVAAPGPLAAVLGLYSLAFAVRAAVWCRVLPGLGFGQALAALHVSLAGNHVLPLRLGEVLRVTSVVRRTGIGLPAATASTVMLRAADVLALVGLVAFSGSLRLAGGWSALVLVLALAPWLGGALWLRRVQPGARLSPLGVPAAAAVAWILESAVLWQAARWAGFELSVTEAVAVTAVTIAAQTLAIAPGGVGTYEAAATAALVAAGAEPGPALAAALAAHGLKTAYALAGGAVAAFVPRPGLFGRLRLPSRHRSERLPEPPPADAPVVLFFPARDEEATVGRVVARTPARVDGRRVVPLVVDDGSRDGTVEAARAAGALVVEAARHRGLGAAVRCGLREAIELDAAAVAFCDADEEYAPEELERLVAPILAGEADYVVGSRFGGRELRMRPHRRLGNAALTRVLSFVARTPIGDGQSGYRALSAAAAADAEIVHDFNYAQVLTLDLLAKGFRYAEVPISYRFRREGRSFVRLLPYLRHVVPAVHRELNTV
jgi:uncharacterized membrane protein YbhN (UPF0104 family)